MTPSLKKSKLKKSSQTFWPNHQIRAVLDISKSNTPTNILKNQWCHLNFCHQKFRIFVDLGQKNIALFPAHRPGEIFLHVTRPQTRKYFFISLYNIWNDITLVTLVTFGCIFHGLNSPSWDFRFSFPQSLQITPIPFIWNKPWWFHKAFNILLTLFRYLDAL